MKQAELVPALMAGEKLMVAEFRGFRVDESESKKKVGEWNVFEKSFVISGMDSIEVVRFASRGKRKCDIAPPAFKVGDRVVVKLRKLERTPFGVRCDGDVEALN